MISLIYARDENYGVGFENGLPWTKDSKDMKRFQTLTKYKIVIMGSATFLSLGLKTLPHRTNFVLTSNKTQTVSAKNLMYINGEVGNTAKIISSMEEEVFVIGGPNVYRQFLPYAGVIHETIITGVYDADTFIDKNTTEGFSEVHSETTETHTYRKLIR